MKALTAAKDELIIYTKYSMYMIYHSNNKTFLRKLYNNDKNNYSLLGCWDGLVFDKAIREIQIRVFDKPYMDS